jgi:diguanylate cyclase (GGDEF)-like protein/PAS domain S-box-containing protein
VTAVLSQVCALCALSAGLSWLLSAWWRRPFGGRCTTAFVGWAGLSAVAHLLTARGDQDAPPTSAMVLFGVGTVLALVGIVDVARRATVRGGVASPVAEALLVGSSVATLLWVLADPPADLAPLAVFSLFLVLADASAVALLLRLPVTSVALVVDWRYRRALLAGAVAAGLFALAAGLTVLDRMGQQPPVAPVGVLTAAGYLVAMVVPWVTEAPGLRHRQPTRVTRVLPYLLVTAVLAAVGVHSAASGSGPVPILLVALVVGGLVAVQALALRENAELLADLEASRQRLSALLENTSDVIVRLDPQGRILTANAATERMLHVPPSALTGRPVSDLAGGQDVAAVREAARAVAGGGRPTAQVELSLAAPATGTAELRLRAVAGGAVANLHDVTDAVQLRRRLERLARFDHMTGLVNRTHLLDIVGEWLDSGSTVTLLYGDLDGFKAVNDRFGHLAGDAVLVEVAERLSHLADSAPAQCGVTGRIGGDEFVLALRGGERAPVRAVAESVVATVRQPFTLRDRAVVLGMSVGVADSAESRLAAGGARGAAELLHRADLAMFAAKSVGRSRVMEWAAELDARAQRRVDIAIGLRKALDAGCLDIAYQPMVRLTDGMVVAVEALLRAPGEGDSGPGALGELAEVVSPAELVEVAEDTGIIVEMGEWVLRTATAQVAAWRAEGHDLSVSVNISVAQLTVGGFPEVVTESLERSGLTPDRLILEITESQLVGNTGPALSVLEALQGRGVALAIDDFGTGYSSLGYLRYLPVRVLKIDKALLDGVGSEEKATTLVRAVVGVAAALDLLVVAEGIEDLATARVLRDLGVWAGQGFALSPALSGPELLTLIRDRGVDLNVLRTRPLRRRTVAAGRSDVRGVREGASRAWWRA